ncbi:hypothetical protein Q3G72_016704 [Acer saccharum]|nr:hypothetical protein Q3G72_016704 [Acer saccharum]
MFNGSHNRSNQPWRDRTVGADIMTGGSNNGQSLARDVKKSVSDEVQMEVELGAGDKSAKHYMIFVSDKIGGQEGKVEAEVGDITTGYTDKDTESEKQSDFIGEDGVVTSLQGTAKTIRTDGDNRTGKVTALPYVNGIIKEKEKEKEKEKIEKDVLLILRRIWIW